MAVDSKVKLALIDLGGTQIRVAISDTEGNFLTRIARPTPPEGGEAVMQAIKGSIRQAIKESKSAISAIALVAPGPLDPKRGVIANAPNIAGWKNIPINAILNKEFNLPVLLGNDASLAASGEQWFGAAKGHHDVVYLTVSTGIGGGVISDDKLLIGAYGYATELGHNSIVANGPRCNCGNYGCLEVYASGPAIARHAREAIQQGQASIFTAMANNDLQAITAKMVAQAAAQGDPVSKQAFETAGFYLGVGIGNFLYAFDPTIVVLGGGVSKAGPLLFDPVIATIKQRIPEAYWSHCQIVPAALGDDVGLMGALALYLSENS